MNNSCLNADRSFQDQLSTAANILIPSLTVKASTSPLFCFRMKGLEARVERGAHPVGKVTVGRRIRLWTA